MVGARVSLTSLLVPLCVYASAAKSLVVQAPTVMLPALTAIASEFKKAHPGLLLTLTDDRRRRANVVVLERQEGIEGREFAQDRLVVASRPDETRITKFSHIGLAMSTTIPESSNLVGRHVVRSLAMAEARYGKDWMANVRRNLKVKVSTPQEALDRVASGKADAAIVNGSAVHSSGKPFKLTPIPLDLASEIEYVAQERRATADSAAFVEFLFASGNQQRLESFGFTSPLHAPPELLIRRSQSITRIFTAAVGSLKSDTVMVGGKKITGVSLRALLAKDSGMVTFVGADLSTLRVRASSIRSRGGVLESMPDGNLRVVLPGVPSSRWIRWLREIRVV